MKRYSLMIFLASIFEILLITACNEKESNPVSNDDIKKDLEIKGSDSEFELMKKLLEEFVNENTGVSYRIEGGGTAKGIEALLKGEVNIAAASRELNDFEWGRAEETDIIPLPVIFALDAVAFITHPEIGIDSLSPAQLTSLMSGEIKNWKELGGADLIVTVIGRDKFSGTAGFLENRLHLHTWNSNKITLQNNLSIYEKVKSTKGSIGYVSLGTIVSSVGKPVSDVWAVNIFTEYSNAVSPYEISKVQNGEYYFSRPLYLYFDAELNSVEKKLIEFLLNENHQNSLWEKGYFPITEQHKRINSKFIK